MKRFVRAEEHASAAKPYFTLVWADDTIEPVRQPQPDGGYRTVMMPTSRETSEVRYYNNAPEREAILAIIRGY